MESNTKPDFSSQREDTLSKMRSQLPEYVVNCLVASGFDTNTALATLDLSDKPGSSQEGIRQYISRKYPDDAMFKSDTFSDVAEFLPGHINLIREFVKDVTRVPFKRQSTSSNPPSKKRAVTASGKPLDNEEEQPMIELDNVAGNIRQQVAAWQRN